MTTDLAGLPGYDLSLRFGQQMSAKPVRRHALALLSPSKSLESQPT